MKVYTDVTCDRCGCTYSTLGIDDLVLTHVCPDGRTSNGRTIKKRVVLGPGERGKHKEEV